MHKTALLALAAAWLSAHASPLEDARLQAYFTRQARTISSNCLADIKTLEDWEKARPKLRAELFEMLSLDPLPSKTDLLPVVTGSVEREDFLVEKLYFQSMPGLYVTANFYLPKHRDGPLPAVLYVCGHGPVKKDGVSYGNKVSYQQHGAWFARNGYACLIVDTVQLGEIEGIHHGTYREGMWWWNSRGYSSAGVEAWNCIRALDYLETRPEVDKTRFGVTGRSGGGAYSWWISALDDRIRASAPVAGITDLEDHVVDGVVEGHCDCMYMVNAHRWDYPAVAALVAPRPLLICNTDKDPIFPLDGVVRLHSKVAKIYDLYKKPRQLGLVITEGPHEDTQELQVPVFRWFNRFLKQSEEPIEMAARRFFEPEELKVFKSLPDASRNAVIHQTFVPRAENPGHAEELLDLLRTKVFGAWPASSHESAVHKQDRESRGEFKVSSIQFESQPDVPVELIVFEPAKTRAEKVIVQVLNESDWPALERILDSRSPAAGPAAEWLSGEENAIVAFFAPRGIGRSAWKGDARKQVQIRRRFMLVGETADSMRVYDIGRAIEVIGRLPETKGLPVDVAANGNAAVNVMFAAILRPGTIRSAELSGLPEEDRGPDYLNVLRVFDFESGRELAAKNVKLTINEH